MEEAKRSERIRQSQLEDVPELFHLIQSFLPIKDAARTCVLSKTWLQAWSTIPTLNWFRHMFDGTEQQRKHLEVVDRTLLRYIQDSIPIETIDLEIDVENQELSSLAKKWIRQVATKTSLKDISLIIHVSNIASFTLPDEIYLCKNLNKIRVITSTGSSINPLWMSSNPMIKCVSLRVLELIDVHISEEVLNNLLSTCSLLEKITLLSCKGLNNIKVKTLRSLSKLRIDSDKEGDILEIDDVPNLRWFIYNSSFHRPITFNMDSLAGVKRLWLGGVKLDDAFFNMIESKFHYLESLTLNMTPWSPQSFKITCLPLKRLFIHSWMSNHILVNIQVFAPKLLFFHYDGMLMPRLEFPATTPKKIKIKLYLNLPIDDLFFIKIMETLLFSSKFDIEISMRTFKVPLNFDIDELKRSVRFPATNVQQLSFETISDEGLWEHSPFFDAFFSICHPKKVVAIRDQRFKENNYFCKLMVREIMEKKSRKDYWPDYLKDVEIRNRQNGKWEKLTDSWKSFFDGSTQVDCYKVEFKLNWH